MSDLYRVGQTGLVVKKQDLTHDEWVEVGRRLFVLQSATQWAIGDWLIYGGGRGTFGDYYREASEISGMPPETLSLYARVAEIFPPARRTRRLSWHHYRAVKGLTEGDQEALLDRAVSDRWNRDRIIEEAQVIKQGLLKAKPPPVEVRPDLTRRKTWHPTYRRGNEYFNCPECGCRIRKRPPLENQQPKSA